MLTRLFHLAINSKDLDKSIAFYKNLGFQVMADRTVDNPEVQKAFMVECSGLRFVHLSLGDDENATLLDIVQWFGPDTPDGQGPPAQNQQGITRFAVLTDDTRAVYEDLKAKGVKILTEPTTVLTPNGGWTVSLVEDPDGVVVQITQLVPAPFE